MRWVLLSLVLATSARADSKPNLLFLFSDDQRHDTLAALGNRDVRTPHLDGLVRDGFAFTHAFCMGSMQPAVCVPSRAMLLTGRSLFRTGAVIPVAQPTWPQVFGKAGYTTFFTGKWHNDPASLGRSFHQGERVFLGGMTDQRRLRLSDFDPTGKFDRKRSRLVEGYSTELFADAAIRFLKEQRKDRPFCAYVAFTSPHDPRTPPEEFARLYDPAKLPLPASFLPKHPFDNGELKIRDELLAPFPRTPEAVRRHLADYYGMISHLDAQVGRVLQALEDAGLEKNTLVIFAGDNGLAVGKHGLMGKQNLYDHSVRVPLVLRGPGVPKGRSDALCYLFDLFPTLAELTGVPAPTTVEGKSLKPVMDGKQKQVRTTIFGAYRDVQRMVRTEKWKLIRYPKVEREQLFDLAADPEETKDLAGEPREAERVKQMQQHLRNSQIEWGDR